MALLVLFAATPVIATPVMKTPFTADVSVVPSSPGKTWEKGGILHIKGSVGMGTITSTSGPDISGDILIIEDEAINPKTGKGSMHAKWVITALDFSFTFEGSTVAKIVFTDPTTSHISGTFKGDGTGIYEGQIIKGSFEGDFEEGVYPMEMELEGIIQSKG